MQIETGLRGRIRRAVPAAAILALVMTGCADASGAQEPSPAGMKVLWLGDSIAGVEAPPLEAALEAAGVEFEDATSDGGGTVVEGHKMTVPLAKSAWQDLRASLASFAPDVVAYQITTYDWGTARQQRDSYEKLGKTVRDAGAELVIVSAPPYELGDFYEKHAAAIKSAPKAAKAVAEAGGVSFFDASALWGTDSAGAEAQRSADGIHSCQQGSAAFAKWFTERLGERYGFTPADPRQWAQGPWAGHERYAKLGCG